MSKEDEKKKKRPITIIVHTNSDEFACGKEVNDCVKQFNGSGKYDVTVLVNRVYYAYTDGAQKMIKHLVIIGPGWNNGVKPFFDCLIKLDYKIQVVLADESHLGHNLHKIGGALV
jgi:hypothetical protein